MDHRHVQQMTNLQLHKSGFTTARWNKPCDIVQHPRSVTVLIRIGKMVDTSTSKNIFASFNDYWVCDKFFHKRVVNYFVLMLLSTLFKRITSMLASISAIAFRGKRSVMTGTANSHTQWCCQATCDHCGPLSLEKKVAVVDSNIQRWCVYTVPTKLQYEIIRNTFLKELITLNH